MNNIKYDVVIVGAGNAGLSAALRCQLAGKKTLIIEQHNLPGGCATSFVRGRFEIEPSLHELCDVGTVENPGEVRKLLTEYGVKIEWKLIPECYRFISKFSDGTPMDVTMPQGKDAFINKIEEYVPGSKEKMILLFDIIDEMHEGGLYSSENSHQASPIDMMKKFPNMLKLGAYPVSKVLDTLDIPKKCQDILSVYWLYLGIDMEHMNFFHYATMIYCYICLGAVMPTHTSHEISMASLNRFYELGGEAWFNCRATEFIFEKDRCIGVKTTMGDVYCDECLPNINPNIIYGKMMPKELVPLREKKLVTARLKNGGFSARMFSAYFCLDCDYHDLGITNYSYFLGSSCDTLKEYHNILNGIDTNDFCIFLCYNVVNKEASPERTCICSITTMCSKEEWSNVSEVDYQALKEKMVNKMLKIVKDKTGIDISDHIEELVIATPWTFARYLNVPEGSVYGYEVREWDAMIARMMMMHTDYPIKGLKPIGAHGPRGDGYCATYSCGDLIAKLALEDLEKQSGGKRK